MSVVLVTATGTAHAITHSSSASNPQVLRVEVTTVGNCSGVPISPGHVLVSAHCVNGSYNVPFASGKSGAFPGDLIVIRDQSNTEIATSHDLPFKALTSESPMNFSSPLASVHDLAVLPLDHRLAVSVAPPARLPFDHTWASDNCPTNFYGTFYGYASGLRKGSAQITRGGYSMFGDVYRAEFSVTSIFEQLPDFTGLPAFGQLLDDNPVLEDGDSGGPMFYGDKLCGINSGRWPSFSCSWHWEVCEFDICVPLPVPYFSCDLGMTNLYTRVDAAGLSLLSLYQSKPPLFDSRGLLFGTCPPGTPGPYDDVDSDGDFLPDACDPCPTRLDKAYRFDGTYTPLDDSDGDGIADECDRCPGYKSDRHEDGNGKWSQPDADHDGMGDECDKCPNSDERKKLSAAGQFVSDLWCCAKDSDCGNAKAKCLPLENVEAGPIYFNACAPTNKRCSWPPDKDGDGWGDQCDNCRSVPNNQADFDDDGVGDQCDNCSGQHPVDPKLGSDNDTTFDLLDQNAITCSSDASCLSQTGETDSECQPGQLRQTATGFSLDEPHCSKLKDADKDGLGDLCDNCVRTPNPQQRNCNKLIEKELLVPYPYLGDACDPNPCTWISPFVMNSDTFDVDDPNHTDLWVTFWQHPQRLPSSVPECLPLPIPGACYSYPGGPNAESKFDTSYTGTPHATVGGRFCRCNLTNADGTYAPATVEECKSQGCDLNEFAYDFPPSEWMQNLPSLVQTAFPPQHQTGGFMDELPGLEMEVSREVPASFAASNPELAQSGLGATAVSWDLTADGAGYLNPLNSVVPAYGLNAVYWAAVRAIPEMNDPASAGVYQQWSNSYYANAFAVQKAPPLSNSIVKCSLGNCGDGCEYCKFWADVMDLIISPEKKVIAKGLQGTVDITSSFSVGAIDLLTEPNLRWMPAAEGSRHLYRGSIGLASVSADGTKLLGALAKVGTQIHPLTRSPSIGSVGIASLEMASDPPGPPARSDFGTVLSATEGSVFVIGGTLATGGLAGDLWRYDFSWKAWQPLPLQGPAPQDVLAATLLPDARSLYFIDERKVGIHQARLVRYDLTAQKTSVLGAWPRTPQIDKVFLTGTDDGTLVLAGSSSTLRYVAGVVLRPSAQSVTIEAGFFRQGVLAFAPVLTEDGLTVPLASPFPPGVENIFVPARELFSQDKPKKGNGKAWGKTPPVDIKDVL